MAESFIRWRRSDYAKLGRAVANFNKKILSASNEEYCIMHCLNHKKDIDDKCWFVNSCDECLQEWLNEES